MSYNALTDQQKVELWNLYRKYDLEMLLTQLANKEAKIKQLEKDLKEKKDQAPSKEVKETNKKLRDENAKLRKVIESLTSGLAKANEDYAPLKKEPKKKTTK